MKKPPEPREKGEPRRATQRRDYPCLAFVRERDSQGAGGLARLVDVSARGAGLLVTAAIPSGARVVVEIAMEGPICFVAEGTVVHTGKAGELHRIGVHFEKPPALVDVNRKRRRRGSSERWRT